MDGVEFQQMRYVLAVAETGSFTRAAQRCLVVQSALSHQIARLERELGARLFERTSRRVRRSCPPPASAWTPRSAPPPRSPRRSARCAGAWRWA
jgi:hypothetical protein